LNERKSEQMQRREPNCAELVEPGRTRVENAAADIEVRLRIAPIENVPALEQPTGENSDEQRQ